MSQSNDSFLFPTDGPVREAIKVAAQHLDREGERELQQRLSLMLAFEAGSPNLSAERKDLLLKVALERMQKGEVSYGSEILYREKHAAYLTLFGRALARSGKLEEALNCLRYVVVPGDLLDLAKRFVEQKQWFHAGSAVALGGGNDEYTEYSEIEGAFDELCQGAMLGRYQLWQEPPLPEEAIHDAHETFISPYLP